MAIVIGGDGGVMAEFGTYDDIRHADLREMCCCCSSHGVVNFSDGRDSEGRRRGC